MRALYVAVAALLTAAPLGAQEAMSSARAQLRREHGGEPSSSMMLRLAEYQFRDATDGYRWDAEAWVGGDVDRFVVKSEGEATHGAGVDSGDVQALYSRAVGVYTDARFGVRQDLRPDRRTFLAAGFQTLLPYWFDVEGTLFASGAGEWLARLEGSYDARITNRWILQPRLELMLSAKDSAALQTGSGLASSELGVRLRYEFRRELAPYLGLSWERRGGATARYARAAGEDTNSVSVVLGLRAFF